MSRKAIVHIGPMKTGSSSIQAWLARSRDEIHDAGFLMPRALGSANMSRLSYIAQVVASGEDLAPIDVKRMEALREEISSQPESIHTVIFSGEMLAHQLKRPNEIGAFKSMLDEFFDDYVILLYLRRQDQLSLSRYSTALRHGFKRARPLSSALDYETILDAWSEQFGHSAIHPRMFDRAAMPEGDVVRDFVTAIGLPPVNLDDQPEDRNPSIRPEAQAFLADLAERVREAGFTEVFSDLPGHTAMTRRLDAAFSGPGAKPSRADAVAFFDTVREPNERVRQAWFPDRPTLFSDDFSAYTDEATPEPTPEQLLDVAMSVLVMLVTRPAAGTGDQPGVKRGARRKSREKKEMRNRKRRFRKLRNRAGSEEESTGSL